MEMEPIKGHHMTTAPAIAAQPQGKAWQSQSAEEVLAQLGSAATGLSAQEAAQRLAANGSNELKEGKRISPLQIFLGQFKSLIIWILIAAGVISGELGDVGEANFLSGTAAIVCDETRVTPDDIKTFIADCVYYCRSEVLSMMNFKGPETT